MHPRLPVLAAACLIAAAVMPVSASARQADGPCTIHGTTGDDTIVGTPGDDVICANHGDDVVYARGGNDVVLGGPGADRVVGGPGHDRIIGGDGADRSYGGRGGDDLVDRHRSNEAYGGPGVDTCPGRADVRVSCVREDRRAPWFTDVTVSRQSVDVTTEDAFVTLTVRARDDSGIRYLRWGMQSADWTLFPHPYGGQQMRLVDGVTRDGVWTARVLIPRGQRAGDYRVHLRLHDRVGKGTWDVETDAVLRVDNSAPDGTGPTVTAVVRPVDEPTVKAGSTLRSRIRVTDDNCGVALVWFGYMYLDEAAPRTGWMPGYGELVSGTMMEGEWRADVPIYTDPTVPSGPGAANLRISVADRCGNYSQWWGPDLYAELVEESSVDPALYGEFPLPGGRGRFTVV